MRRCFWSLGLLGLVVAAIWLAAGFASAASQKKDTESEKGDKAAGTADSKKGHAKEEEHKHAPKAQDEVMDQDETWAIFHELDISLPLVGWFEIGGYKVPTKYMWLILFVATLIIWIYLRVARSVVTGDPPRGPFLNAFESLLTFVRDDIAKPNFPEEHPDDHGHGGHDPAHADAAHGHPAGHDADAAEDKAHPADRFVPFLWTLFLFILFCNLLGMIPFMGSPTANLFVTGALALSVFCILHGAAMAKMGVPAYIKSLWPPFEMPLALSLWVKPMIFVIELMGTFIKSFVLAMRLFANMFAGHMVIANILIFIWMTKDSGLWAVVTSMSVLGVIALSLLELFVAFLQAYIFTFLTALFVGMAMNPQH